MFLGHEWLKKHNPTIDWNMSKLDFNRCPSDCNMMVRFFDPEEDLETYCPEVNLEEGDRIVQINFLNVEDTSIPDVMHHIRAHGTTAQQLAEAAGKDQKTGGFEGIVPKYLHEFKDIFDKKEFDALPKEDNGTMQSN
ncbi:hypothetical protein SERLA73DRAFT_74389 [Serpula lacrymans var. lacrymans S7.3]|uniref:Uncharacterized protein n=1 Tax=Serpula lacrymans var. lacrymans (strain S7.3) TaxID=936435 RepID=F8Q1I1_SERL3|nr:hypothetical protein SERLA73DRAFT_74389 [Serpula lacrymans var. lacrymans S7.3]